MRFWLALHIIAVGTWLGANVAQLIVGARIRRAPGEVRSWWTHVGELLGKALYPAAGVVVLVTGIIMVIVGDQYSFASTFVSIGFAAVIVGAVLGGAVFGPRNRAAREAIASGDAEAESSARSTIINFAYLDTAIVVFTIFAMVFTMGAKLK
jgi:hypothetical protein